MVRSSRRERMSRGNPCDESDDERDEDGDGAREPALPGTSSRPEADESDEPQQADRSGLDDQRDQRPERLGLVCIPSDDVGKQQHEERHRDGRDPVQCFRHGLGAAASGPTLEKPGC
jgi:hypothetical protein